MAVRTKHGLRPGETVLVTYKSKTDLVEPWANNGPFKVPVKPKVACHHTYTICSVCFTRWSVEYLIEVQS